MCGVVSTLILNYFREGILTTDDTDGRGFSGQFPVNLEYLIR